MKNQLLIHYQNILRIRLFEEKVLNLFYNGMIRGTTHVCIGQEAVAVGACSSLDNSDYITSNHRGHGHLIARGASLDRLMAELFGKEDGYSRGAGGSQHIAVAELNFLGSNGITGGGIPIATGAALKIKLKKQKAISVCFTGDGATAQGTFHESLNMASVMELPLLVIVENNQYAMSTHLSATSPTKVIANRTKGYNIKAITIDGNDVRAVEQAVKEAKEYIIKNNCPFLIEAMTTRLKGHSRSDDCSYIDPNTIKKWKEKGPVLNIENEIRKTHNLDFDFDSIKEKISTEIQSAITFAQNSNFLDFKKYQQNNIKSTTIKIKPKQTKDYSYMQAINLALSDELQNNGKVVLLGEDIAKYGGAFKVTKDLFEKFGEKRIINTPICENSFVGMAIGAAMSGMRPVVEIMFMDFILLALDQIANHAAKFPTIYAGEYSVPLTIRTPAGGRRGYGATHSQCFESILAKIPGLMVVSPFTVNDAYHQTRQAINCDSPVIIVEHKGLYSQRGEIDFSTSISINKARILRKGSDITIISYSQMLQLSLEAANALASENISAEVIDLRCLNPIDIETIVASVIKTGKVIFAEEGNKTGGIGSEVTSLIQEKCFGYLEAPIVRIAAVDIAIPAAKPLEEQTLPQIQDIIKAVKKLIADY